MESTSRPSGGGDATSSNSFGGTLGPRPDPRDASPRTFATDRDHDHRDQNNSQSTSSQTPSSSNSQDTSVSAFSASTTGSHIPHAHSGIASHLNQGSGVRNSYVNGHSQGPAYDSSREASQLSALSQLAAASEQMPNLETPMSPVDAGSRKRMADGVVKAHHRQRSSASPVFSAGGHSRNTSTVSVASTSASRMSELSHDLKTRLSYAMVKVNNGWQSHSIDQVESLASQAASPTSSSSTPHGRFRSSASPGLALSSRSQNSTPTSGIDHHFPAQSESAWHGPVGARVSPALASPLAPLNGHPSLAPPISLQPTQPSVSSRRNSKPRHTPAFISTSHHASPHTPSQASPAHAPLRSRFGGQLSPAHNVREQDAIETLLFMSSPNNSANMKRNLPVSSSQPLPSLRNGASSNAGRTALPGSQSRKSLPNRRPAQQSLSQPGKRVGFDKSPGAIGAMDVDEPFGTPTTTMSDYSHGTPRRRVNGGGVSSDTTPRPKVALSAGLNAGYRGRPARGEDEIDRILSRRTAEDSSDSDEEIPLRPQRASSGGPVGV